MWERAGPVVAEEEVATMAVVVVARRMRRRLRLVAGEGARALRPETTRRASLAWAVIPATRRMMTTTTTPVRAAMAAKDGDGAERRVLPAGL